MINLTSVCKTYKLKKSKSQQALKDITLNLPDNGLVFILGKSGSGKSTLLNLIGGLDSPTSGNIKVDNHNLSTLKKDEFANYRNSHIGFIFQDFYLINEFTVYENISLALDLQGITDRKLVLDTLKKVGLEGYEDKYPNELSGGERQRVAIARAIIKKPQFILADEPTGNLDTDTTAEIFELLRSLSKENLVLIISHDKISAQQYADHIIQIANGKIILDDISDNIEKNILNETSTSFITKQKAIIRKCFFRNKLPRILFYSFMVTTIMIVLLLTQTITNFDSEQIIKREFEKNNSDSLFLTKTLDDSQKNDMETLNKLTNGFPKIEYSDIEAFKDAGYKDKIYEVYKCNININQSQVSAGIASNVFNDSLYILEPLGVIVVDEDFLLKKYGKLNYIAKADYIHPTGIIITDYLADIMLKSDQLTYATNYEDLLGEYHWGTRTSYSCVSRGYINAIIDTGYKEKYESLFKKSETYDSDDAKKILENEEFLALVEDIHKMYGFCYSLNPNFIEETMNNPSWDMVWHYALQFENKDIFTTEIPQVRNASFYGIELEENEVLMEIKTYNSVFGTQYTSSTLDDFIPHTEVLNHYLYSDLNKEDILFSQEIKIVGLFVSNENDMSGTFIAGNNIYNLFAKDHFYTTGLYFDNQEDVIKIFDTASKLGFQKNLIVSESLKTMTRVVDIFVPIFKLLSIILCIAVIFILMNYSSRMINSKMHEIGILKALGAQNKTIGFIFGLQVFLIAVFTTLFSTLGYALLVNETNDLLVNSLQSFVSGKMIPDLDFLVFRFDIALKNAILVFALTLISFIMPMIKICTLNPINIIKSNT